MKRLTGWDETYDYLLRLHLAHDRGEPLPFTPVEVGRMAQQAENLRKTFNGDK